MASSLVATFLVLLSFARSARADVLAFDVAAPSCPARGVFVASVLARTELGRLDGTVGRTFGVRLGTTGRGEEPFAGTLTVDAPGAPRWIREVEGISCADVADALSLVVALAIDPDARVSPALARPTITEARLPSGGEPSADRPVRVEPVATTRGRLSSRVALEATGAAGAAPSPMLGAAIALSARRGEVSPGIHWGPAASARAGVEKTMLDVSSPSADVLRATASLALCPLAIGIDRFVLEPCAGATAGIVRVEGEGATVSTTNVRPWVHVDTDLQGDLRLRGDLFLRLRVGMELPITRDDLVFVRPDVFVHRAAPVGAHVAAGLGLWL